jgi:DNA-binding CsgD family transcriptional regulator
MGFVGRDRELARLAAALERAADRRPGRVALTGPAGAGISRLLTELTARLAGLSDVVVLRGVAHEPLSGVPYAPLAEALRPPLTAASDTDLTSVVGGAGTEIAALLPDLAERLGALGCISKEVLRSAPDQQASRMAEALMGAFERMAGDGIVLLALEDLQWADPATRRFVDTVLRVGRGLPLCVVLAYRPDELHRRHPMRGLADAIESNATVERLAVGPLERHETAALLEALLGERPSGAFLAAALEGSGGNPLLIEQLVAAQAHEGIRLSDPFDDIVRARLADQSAAAVRCLRVLAAARRPLPVERLLAVELPGGRLARQALTDAVASGLAVERDDATPGGERQAAILHQRYAEAVESLGLPAERQPIHEGLARALAGSPAEGAWHLETAMRFAAARNAHLAAGMAAETLDPGGTAFLHYQRALELAEAHEPREPKPALSLPELLGRAADAAFADDNAGAAAELAHQAIAELAGAPAAAAAARRGDHDGRALQAEVGLLYLRLGRYRSAAGDHLAAGQALETAAQLIPEGATPERARALAARAQVLMLDGRFEESAVLAAEARDVAGAAGPAAVAERGHATCTLGVDVGYGGAIDAGLTLLEEAGRLARSAGRLDDLMRTYANQTHLLELDARYEAALAVVQDGIIEARRWGQEAAYGAFLRGNAADILFKLGRWRESEAECRAALERSSQRLAWSPLLALGAVLVESRADDEASRLVGQILLQLEAMPDGQWMATLQRIAVSFALWRADVADAERVARRGWERVLATGDRRQVALAASTTAEACAAAADAARGRRDMGTVATVTELASSVVADAERLADGASIPPGLGSTGEARLHIATARAHLGRVRGRANPDEWAAVAAGWQALGIPYLAARARWWEAANALQGRDQRPRAAQALRAAWELAVALAARPLQRELVRLAQRGRITLPLMSPAAAGRPAVAVGPGRPAEPIGGVTSPGEPLASLPVLPFLAAGEPDPATQLSLDDTGRWPSDIDVDEAQAPGIVGALAGLPSAESGNGHLSEVQSATGRAISERLLPIEAPPPRDPFNLSPREYEVLTIIAEGRTNREIAERLFISERTVAVHVRNILAKLGVSGRVEATSVSLRLGLVPGVAPAGVGR